MSEVCCPTCYELYKAMCFSVTLPTCLHKLRRSSCISNKNHKNILQIMGFWEILSGTFFFKMQKTMLSTDYKCVQMPNVLLSVHVTCSSQVIMCEDYSLEGYGTVVYPFQSIHILYQYYIFIFMHLTSMQYSLQY